MNVYDIADWFSSHLNRMLLVGFFVLIIFVIPTAIAAWADRKGSRYPFP